LHSNISAFGPTGVKLKRVVATGIAVKLSCLPFRGAGKRERQGQRSGLIGYARRNSSIGAKASDQRKLALGRVRRAARSHFATN
jgi:hypothetical protein